MTVGSMLMGIFTCMHIVCVYVCVYVYECVDRQIQKLRCRRSETQASPRQRNEFYYKIPH